MASRWHAFSLNSSMIYVGPWSNWNDNYADGGRITVSKQLADLIMIFTGIFFVFMEAGLCSIVTLALFAYHRHRRPYDPPPLIPPPSAVSSSAPASASARSAGRRAKKSLPRDAMWHQRQASLRNSGGFLSIGSRFLSLWLTYRRLRPKTSLLWILGASVGAVVTAGVFLVALPCLTTFVMLHEDGNEVLIRSSRCAMYETDNHSNKRVDMTGRWLMAIQYADSCYEDTPSSELCNNYFVETKLNWTETSVECPFSSDSSDICLLAEDSKDGKPAIEITTRGLNSHRDLGLNARRSDRIEFNRTVTCAPLHLVPYTEKNNSAMYVHLGNVSGFEGEPTYIGLNGRSASYQRFTLHGYMSDVDWDPIPELQVANANTSLVFLHNPNILIQTKGNVACKDPFFHASRPENKDGSPGFLPTRPVTAIGCTEHLTIGNPSNRTVGSFRVPLMWSGARNEERKEALKNQTEEIRKALCFNQKQRDTLELTLWAFSNAGTVGQMVSIMGVGALRAAKDPGHFGGRVLNEIVQDQWKTEVRYWVKIGLAALQQEFVRFATGPAIQVKKDGKGQDLRDDEAREEGGVCGQQKIKQTEFKNFRRPGFIALATVGAILIVVPWLAIKMIVWLGRRNRWPSVLEWLSYGDLQLLRMANEGAGVQGWQGCDDEVPFIEVDEVAHVDLDDLRHPRMKPMTSATELVECGSQPASVHSTLTERLLG